jgi:A nuclease family of the HNH/ENDO VII superfamily with conserved AHH
MAGSTNQDPNFIDRNPQTADDSTQLAYFSPLDWLDYAGLAWDAVERVHIETTMPEGREKESARLLNNIYTAIDAVMAAIPGGGGGGPAFRAAMATSHEAGVAAWKALPDSAKQRLIEQVARGMNWSLIKTQQAINVLFSVRSNTPTPQQGDGDGSNRGNAAEILGNNMEKANNQLKKKGLPSEPGWVPKPGYAAHHIVPYTEGAYAGSKRGPFVERAQAVLKKFNIGINEPGNGVFLPHNKDVRIDARNGGGAYHPRVHTAAIYKELAEKLEKATSKAEVYKVLDEFRDRFVKNLDKLTELPIEEQYAETRTAQILQPTESVSQVANYEQQPERIRDLVAERLGALVAANGTSDSANGYAGEDTQRLQESDSRTTGTPFSPEFTRSTAELAERSRAFHEWTTGLKNAPGAAGEQRRFDGADASTLSASIGSRQRPISTDSPELRASLEYLEKVIGTMEQDQRAEPQADRQSSQQAYQQNQPTRGGDQLAL